MIESNIRQRDWWVPQVEITADNNTIEISDVSTEVITIPVGDYWMHASTNVDYPGLYRAIETALNASGLSGVNTKPVSPN